MYVYAYAYASACACAYNSANHCVGPNTDSESVVLCLKCSSSWDKLSRLLFNSIASIVSYFEGNPSMITSPLSGNKVKVRFVECGLP